MTLALSVSDLGLVVSLLCFLTHKTRMLAVDLKKKKIAEVTFIHAIAQGIKQ